MLLSVTNDLDYEYLKSKDETWYCKTCILEILPFCNEKINPNNINLGNAGIDPNLKKKKFFSFFHLNINSFSRNFDNFNHLLNKLKLKFDILGIS